MLLLAFMVACILHKKRISGKEEKGKIYNKLVYRNYCIQFPQKIMKIGRNWKNQSKLESTFLIFNIFSFKLFTGNEEERKSFRTKGIPVIFQDEYEEKQEIASQSPVILKEEKPPSLLPPSYGIINSTEGKFNRLKI